MGKSEKEKAKRYQLVKLDYFKKADVILTILKDLDTGRKIMSSMPGPEIEFHIGKKEHALSTPVHFVKESETDKIVCPYRKLFLVLAEELVRRGFDESAMDFYRDCMSSKNFRELSRLGFDPNVHSSDVNVADYYISRFLRKFPQDPSYSPTKGFFDIEVDTQGYDRFPNEAEAPCPINAISYLSVESKRMIVWLLRNPENLLCEEFIENVEFHKARLTKAMARVSKKAWMPCLADDIVFNVFDKELEMIESFLGFVNNEERPDFACAWNMKFDILTIVNRLKRLAGEERAARAVCAADAPTNDFFYYDDTINQDWADKGDFFQAAGYVNWTDQMLIFAALRKADGKRESYALNAIAQEELGVGKVEFGEGETIQNLPYVNYAKFMKYNVIDTYILGLIDAKNEDIDQMYSLSLMTETRISKVLKKTVSLRNLLAKFAKENGLVLSNNRNAFNKSGKTFRGGFVAEPSLNSENGMVVSGVSSKFLFENVIDMDLASLYPTICILFKTDSSNQIGRAILPAEQGSEIPAESGLVDHIVAGDAVHTGKKYFGLPDADELIRAFEEIAEPEEEKE